MIDYEKLNIAIELVKESSGYSAAFYFGDELKSDAFVLWREGENIGKYTEIDDLIAGLKMHIQKNPPYRIGDTIWFYDLDGWLRSIKINKIEFLDEAVQYIYYDFSKKYCVNSSINLFKSKIEALEFELERLRKEEISTGSDDMSMQDTCNHREFGSAGDALYFCGECNKSYWGCFHESDGQIYASNPPQNKCKKCGEFY